MYSEPAGSHCQMCPVQIFLFQEKNQTFISCLFLKRFTFLKEMIVFVADPTTSTITDAIPFSGVCVNQGQSLFTDVIFFPKWWQLCCLPLWAFHFHIMYWESVCMTLFFHQSFGSLVQRQIRQSGSTQLAMTASRY